MSGRRMPGTAGTSNCPASCPTVPPIRSSSRRTGGSRQSRRLGDTRPLDRSSYKHFDAASTHREAASSWSRSARTTGGGGRGYLWCSPHSEEAEALPLELVLVLLLARTLHEQLQAIPATDLHIELEYGLCTIVRPWLISYLFFMSTGICEPEEELDQRRNDSTDRSTARRKADADDPAAVPRFAQRRYPVFNWGSDGSKLAEYDGAAEGQAGLTRAT